MHSLEAGSEPAISVSGLVKSFGDVRALDGVDLEAAPGTVLGVLGPNGAGKTTTVRILSTLLTPDAGTARVAGLDVVRDAGAARVGLEQRGEDAHGRGLAGPVGAEDPKDGAARDLEVDTVERAHLPEPLDHAADGDCRLVTGFFE